MVFISASSGEQYVNIDGNAGDRNNLTAWGNGDALVKAIADRNNNTIVIVEAVGPVFLEEWIEHENVTAVIWTGLLGQEAGDALTEVLFGKTNPSGRLPFTLAKSRSDYGTDVIYSASAITSSPDIQAEVNVNQ